TAVSAAWGAGRVRARALARRRLGVGGARALLSAGSFAAAVEMLASSPYAHRSDAREPAARYGVHPGDDPHIAAHGVAAALLWNIRVLAGWLPDHGTQTLRLLAGWFEIANTEERVRELAGQPAGPTHTLGRLATAWPRIAAARTPDELRAALAASPWQDPGSAGARDIQICLRLVWADRVSTRLPAARPWALGAAALLLAREQTARGEPLPEQAQQAARRTL